MTIEGRKERVKNPHYNPNAKKEDWRRSREFAEYTSASLLTHSKKTWCYGRFECRAKIPTGEGMWPAFWTTGRGESWPAGGEIDIMEFYRGTLLANFCWGGNTWRTKKVPLEQLQKLDPRWNEKFHVFRMDWSEDEISLYCDDYLLNRISLAEAYNPPGSFKKIREPFKHAHGIILNLALGATGGRLDNVKWPVKMQVDYVRVYQRK